ncbi:HTH-type transcriptional regulator VirS [Nocardioides psychrotolerans]|uniref:AraC-type DNA-binding protein n=1 Tax=Nocardioides psychrotolerans TaxID=1005945 RepID=A0A1I3RFN6_9ACTN|nr:AraC family transcriptional regulator [Nocardioides psychrotolerans]GEP40430.1 HTH-type transcriptional regulator VirS [Nocardioides psychrotolerans]SFJ44097.1 AraC-type DNA-binding protein [Nocardioides psychrotolerans]
MPAIRSAGLRGLRETITSLGGDADHYARLGGLDPAALDADDILMPDLAAATTLELAAADLGCPDLGLRVAEHQDLSLLGPLALAIQNAPTVAEALECTSRYLFLHAPAMRLTLEPDPDGIDGVAALRYDVTAPGVAPPPQGTDLCLGSLHRAIRSLVGDDYDLRSVDLPHPPLAPPATYEAFFSAPVRFDRPSALLRFPSSLRQVRLTGSDELVRQLALDHLAEQSPADAALLAPRVRSTIDQLLGTGAPEITAVARVLSLHPRTLQRRLADEGTSFAEILDAVRASAARRYLVTTDLPLSQVAGLIGLSEQSALTRASRRWWDQTPRAVRRAGVAQGQRLVALGQES